MTPTEFKAWFDGFTEALSGVPTEEQWKRIKARVAEIDGRPITQQVYIDRYWPQRIYDSYPRWRDIYCSAQSAKETTFRSLGASNAVCGGDFDGIKAMYASGRNDAASFS